MFLGEKKYLFKIIVALHKMKKLELSPQNFHYEVLNPLYSGLKLIHFHFTHMGLSYFDTPLTSPPQGKFSARNVILS